MASMFFETGSSSSSSSFFETGSSSSSSSSSLPRKTHDVFLSFRGEDTRRNFTDHLYNALVQAGVHTFRDNDHLPRGEEISSQLLEAIRGSKISIVVFSKGYATSTWCLEELANIMECRKTKYQVVLPVFYDIDPSDVRKQKRSFAEAFQTHEQFFKEDMEKVNRWRKALSEASTLSGWDLNTMANRHESDLIRNIVEDVSVKLGPNRLYCPEHLVGIDSHVDNIIALLRIVTDDSRIVGIHGMGGVGKTTLAKVLFNLLFCEFEGSSFLSNVSELSKAPNGLVQLQNQLLCDTLKTKNIVKINNVDRGMISITERLCYKRVLVVLDDVDNEYQVKALVGENRFGPGSVIMVTSRNEHLLNRFTVHVKYEAKLLTQDESLQLFSWHAFRTIHPPDDYAELSNDVLKCAGGLPLALDVLGASLFGKNKSAWRSAIEKLRKTPDHDVQAKLMISYDALDDDILKNIFLDIACFFVGRNKEYVSTILHARYGFNQEINLTILVERSLLEVNLQNQLRMHDLVRDMGRAIVYQMCPQHPGKRSRIWLHEEAWEVLNMNMGRKQVEGLVLDVQTSNAEPLRTESFKNMKYLKLLQINGVRLKGCYRHLPIGIIWLCWHGCSLRSFPPKFHLDSLVVLDMQYSNIKELMKPLNNLKILNLSNSKFAKTPNFLDVVRLERLILEDCRNLAEVHQSAGHLKELVHLSLKGCYSLNNLPESICNLKSLETLDISMCSRLENLPEHLGVMESLTELLADETAIRQLPSSVGQLKRLRKLSLSGCNSKQDSPFTSWLSLISSWLSPTSSTSKVLLPASLSSLSLLRGLDLSYRGLSEGEISIDLGSLSSLQELNLSGNKFFNLPSGIGLLPKLNYLLVKDCTNLLSVPELPPSLMELDAVNCSALERLTINSKRIPSLYVSGCKNLIEIEGMEGMGKRWVIVSEDRSNLSNNLKQSLVQALCKGEEYDIVIADGEMPELFSNRGEGSSLSFHIPPGSDGNKIQGLVAWVVCAIDGNISAYLRGEAVIKNKSNGVQLFKRSIMLFTMSTNSSNQCSWVNHISLAALDPNAMKAGEELELSVEVKHTFFEVQKCGVHMIVKKPEVE